jgi:hypothetical protein
MCFATEPDVRRAQIVYVSLVIFLSDPSQTAAPPDRPTLFTPENNGSQKSTEFLRLCTGFALPVRTNM